MSKVNLTNLDLPWTDPYSHLNGHYWIKILIGMSQILALAFGSGLNSGIIHYERYGGDPMKRGVLNQIVSNMVGLNLVSYYLITPLNVWRMTIGPLTGITFWFMWFLGSLIFFFMLFSTLQYVFIKYLIIISQMLPVSEDLVVTFLFWTNLANGSLWSFVNLYTVEGFKYEMKFAGLPPALNTYSKFHPRLYDTFFLLSLPIFIILGIQIYFEKKRAKRVISPRPDNKNQSKPTRRL